MVRGLRCEARRQALSRPRRPRAHLVSQCRLRWDPIRGKRRLTAGRGRVVGKPYVTRLGKSCPSSAQNMPTVYCTLAHCALASLRKGCWRSFHTGRKAQMALTIAVAPPSALTRQTVGRNVWNQLRSRSSDLSVLHRAPDTP
jgi:hypothetical protein